MLYITVLRPDGTERNYDWKVDERKPSVYGEKVLEIRTDGPELKEIRQLFSPPMGSALTYTIPMTHNDTVTWVGDIAATIYANL